MLNSRNDDYLNGTSVNTEMSNGFTLAVGGDGTEPIISEPILANSGELLLWEILELHLNAGYRTQLALIKEVYSFNSSWPVIFDPSCARNKTLIYSAGLKVISK